MSHGDRRRAQILDAGLALWPDVTARNVAKSLGLTHSAVLYHFKTSQALRDAIAVHAFAVKCRRVVPMLIVARHPASSVLSAVERTEYLSRV